MVTSVTPVPEQQHIPRAQARAGGQDAHVRLDFVAYLDSSTSTTQLANETLDQSHAAARNRAGEYCCNQQYSVTAITTSTGTIAERYAYSAYGQPTILDASGSVLNASSISNRYTYTGREWDATLGLHHFRARWMSPIAGRFLGRDLIGYLDGQNLYQAFSVNVSFVDPEGTRKIRHTGPPTVYEWEPGDDPSPTSSSRCFTNSQYGPIWQPCPPIKIGTVRHKGKKRCVFVMAGTGTTAQHTPEGNVIYVSSDLSVITAAIRRYKCCEIVFMGHQNKSQGGVVSLPPPGERIQVLPNEDFEKELAKAFRDIGCKKCSLYNYACASLLEHDSEGVTFNKNRNQIASNTGCDVYGLYDKSFMTGDSPTINSANCKNWTGPDQLPSCVPAEIWKWSAATY